MVSIPREIVWDYPEPPPDDLWRLQRIADFFPHFGRDAATVAALHRRVDDLRVPPEVRALIAIYARQLGVDRRDA
jgi:hypothetical protein